MKTASPAQTAPAATRPEVTVKLLARMPAELAARQFGRQLPPDGALGNCRFIFDPTTTDYDWLVVYHDLHGAHGDGGVERLRCPRANTILITTEPSTITVYGTDYLGQYGTVITSQEPWVIKHPNPLFTQPGLIWFYGFPFDAGEILTYEAMRSTPPPAKSRLISTVCSSRQGIITTHSRRVKFTARLQAALPELEVFGHGVRPMSDKAAALDPYQYHIAVENHRYRHHLTEKLPDAFLGHTLPFYHGCPNATDYFPPESFIPIDITDFTRTLAIIKSTIANNEYQDRLPYIREARRLVLEKYNLFAVIERYISMNPRKSDSYAAGTIMNRQALRRRHPLVAVRSLLEKITVKGRHLLGGVSP